MLDPTHETDIAPIPHGGEWTVIAGAAVGIVLAFTALGVAHVVFAGFREEDLSAHDVGHAKLLGEVLQTGQQSMVFLIALATVIIIPMRPRGLGALAHAKFDGLLP